MDTLFCVFRVADIVCVREFVYDCVCIGYIYILEGVYI